MGNYRETFTILSRTYGIEDLDQPGPHFFVTRTQDAHGRFRLWAGGCSIGQANTIEEARQKLHAYIATRLGENLRNYQVQVAELTNALAVLEDPFHLALFLVQKDSVQAQTISVG